VCGLTGYFAPGAEDEPQMRATIVRMTATLRHRGPDDDGIWVDAGAGIALGSRRLAVLDLSAEGHQPMVSASGRYVIAYNGEIYDHRDLQRELEGRGHRFRGHSDTEAILAGIDEWGLTKTLSRLNGMFAFALWDRRERRLRLVRDRIGIKPLYYGRLGAAFLFGSELKALAAHPAFRGDEVERDALALYLRHGYVPTPYCIHPGLHKLAPGSIVTVDKDGGATEPVQFWDARTVALDAHDRPLSGDPRAIEDELEALLGDAVRLRAEASDVAVGAFLSGGIDSSLIVALLRAGTTGRVRTFTIGFREGQSDEAEFARAVADHLGTDHTELTVGPRESLDVVPQLPSLWDEPFADASQIPTHLVSRLARDHVTVALSGDGGDELFGGYVRHVKAPAIWRLLERTPRSVRAAAARAVGRVESKTWERLLTVAEPILPARLRMSHPADKMQKLGEILDATSQAELYLRLTSYWKRPTDLVRGSHEPKTALTTADPRLDGLGFCERMMLLDAVSYLPDDILTKVDRASMGVGLEARVPFLDHRVFELAWRIPLAHKVRDGHGKRVLRRLLGRHIPARLIDRPKKGFDVPIDEWLRGELRPWAEELLAEPALTAAGLEAGPIRARWRDHLAGHRNEMDRLWVVLMFQAWRRG